MIAPDPNPIQFAGGCGYGTQPVLHVARHVGSEANRDWILDWLRAERGAAAGHACTVHCHIAWTGVCQGGTAATGVGAVSSHMPCMLCALCDRPAWPFHCKLVANILASHISLLAAACMASVECGLLRTGPASQPVLGLHAAQTADGEQLLAVTVAGDGVALYNSTGQVRAMRRRATTPAAPRLTRHPTRATTHYCRSLLCWSRLPWEAPVGCPSRRLPS